MGGSDASCVVRYCRVNSVVGRIAESCFLDCCRIVKCVFPDSSSVSVPRSKAFTEHLTTVKINFRVCTPLLCR